MAFRRFEDLALALCVTMCAHPTQSTSESPLSCVPPFELGEGEEDVSIMTSDSNAQFVRNEPGASASSRTIGSPISFKLRRFLSMTSMRHSSLLEAHLLAERKRITSEGDHPLTEVSTFSEFEQSDRISSKLVHPPRTKRKSSVKRYYKHQDSLRQYFKDDEQMIEKYLTEKRGVGKQRKSVLSATTIKEEELASEDSGLIVVACPNGATPTAHDDLPIENRAPSHRRSKEEKSVRNLSRLSFAVNVLLLCIKVVAVGMTGSYAIISSLVDSCVDLTSGSVIWWTERAIRKRDPYEYPRGRTRLQPLALVIISVVMAVASMQVIVQSVDALITGDFLPNVHIVAILLMATAVVLKLGLYIVCRTQNATLKDSSIAVLAQDHGNDCISNSVAIACAYAGSHFNKYVDPAGAVLVSLYIAYTWFSTGYSQIKMLSGRSADASFINRIINIATKHDDRIRSIDTVYVYHFGARYLVEVHIVMDAEMTLRDSHDIGETLQCKLESLEYVERAFVHADYECEHRPEDEHVVV